MIFKRKSEDFGTTPQYCLTIPNPNFEGNVVDSVLPGGKLVKFRLTERTGNTLKIYAAYMPFSLVAESPLYSPPEVKKCRRKMHK